MVPYTLALLRSALHRFLSRWYFTYQRSSLGAVDQDDNIPALWQVIVRFKPIWTIFTLRSSPSAIALVALPSRSFGQLYLTHSRSFAALSAGNVSGSGAIHQCRSSPTGCPQLLKQVTLRPRSLLSLFQRPSITENTYTTTSSTPSSRETFDQSSTDVTVGSLPWVFHWCNETSLGRTGLTRERWCCALGVGRLG